jgi:hypothetical protein
MSFWRQLTDRLRSKPREPQRLDYLNEGLALERQGDGTLSGAHYGLAFLLLKQRDVEKAAEHLRAFLSRPPKGADADRWIRHAENTLHRMEEASEPQPAAIASY